VLNRLAGLLSGSPLKDVLGEGSVEDRAEVIALAGSEGRLANGAEGLTARDTFTEETADGEHAPAGVYSRAIT